MKTIWLLLKNIRIWVGEISQLIEACFPPSIMTCVQCHVFNPIEEENQFPKVSSDRLCTLDVCPCTHTWQIRKKLLEFTVDSTVCFYKVQRIYKRESCAMPGIRWTLKIYMLMEPNLCVDQGTQRSTVCVADSSDSWIPQPSWRGRRAGCLTSLFPKLLHLLSQLRSSV